MARILSIDYGKKRTGLAWTDPLQIIATGLDTLSTPQLRDWLAKTVGQEEIEAILVGYPTRMDGSDSHVTE
ncbi:MAG: Holliday junction resolvase RuvX, partial [Bacteroidota bacterium]